MNTGARKTLRLEAIMAYTRRAALAGAAVLGAACSASAQEIEHGGFLHGVASGDPLTDSVIIWTRVKPAMMGENVTLGWVVAHDAGLRRIVKSLPVDEPMKILSPQTSLGLVFRASSKLSFETPI